MIASRTSWGISTRLLGAFTTAFLNLALLVLEAEDIEEDMEPHLLPWGWPTSISFDVPADILKEDCGDDLFRNVGLFRPVITRIYGRNRRWVGARGPTDHCVEDVD